MMNPNINQNVLLSLSCQHKLSTGQGVSLHMLSKWLQCSKPSAKAHVEELGVMNEQREYYRANVQKIVYVPTKEEFEQFNAGVYRVDYLIYAKSIVGNWA